MKLKIIVINVIFAIFFTLSTHVPVWANGVPPAPPPSSSSLGCGGGLGPIAKFLCTLANTNYQQPDVKKQEVGNRLNSVISQIIGFLTIVAALWFFFQFIIAGLGWISAGGNKDSLENARKKLMNSVIGITIVAAAWVIVGVIGTMLGLDILDPGAIMQTIGL